MADNEYIKRDKAIAGLVKLLHLSNHVEGRDATPQEIEAILKTFSDSGSVFDLSKLAIAYSEGLIIGYENGTFRPDSFLTNAEALVFLARVHEKYFRN